MSEVLQYGADYPMSFLWIPLPPEGIDFSLPENQSKMTENIIQLFRMVDKRMEDQGLARSEWSFVSHSLVNLGSDLLVTALVKIHRQNETP